MTSHVSRVSAERPLLGAVLCCTSISPEDRTRLAEYAQQMGAEHKLDLTSDVTHLLVGATDTAKYAYVAREREDVRVLRPEWIEALRQLWMEDRKIDLNVLDAQYRVETFAGLRICITGFDDLAFRSKLADNVKQNGGEYCGDLTKDVTHLIAANTDGKKYEYATIWNKKVVGLKWYKDSLERGMQLAEDFYHPTIPVDQQGIGAWNRQIRQQLTTGKRSNDDNASQEPTRKLRRTASARLSGHADNIWGDIVNGGNADGQLTAREQDALRPSKSMSNILRPIPDIPSFDATLTSNTAAVSANKQDPSKYLYGVYITIRDFDPKRSRILRDVLDSLGASVFDDVADLITDQDVTSFNSYIMVPYTSRPATLSLLKRSSIRPTMVSELWLEECMTCKQLISIEEYPLGGMIAEVKNSKLQDMMINATGFQSITTLHISKVIAVTGAKYTETFSDKCSVLIVNTSPGHNASAQKQGAAHQWKVPVVTEKWLWQLIKTGDAPSPSMQPSTADDDDDGNDMQKQLMRKRRIPANQNGTKGNNAGHPTNSAGTKSDTTSKELLNDSTPFLENSFSNLATMDTNSNSRSLLTKSIQQVSRTSLGSKSGSSDEALKEISPNSPTKSHSTSILGGKAYDGTFDTKENELKDAGKTLLKWPDIQRRSSSPEKRPHDALAMNIAIQDLLDMKAKAKANARKADQDSSVKADRKTLFGRALSNLSNTSRNSQPRQSRASSIDSLNTDGVGSELPPTSARSRAIIDADNPERKNSISLTGRATHNTTILTTSTVPAQSPIDLSDPNLCRDEYADPPAPPLTQLGYEDSDEAVLLRERLAERRRLRSAKNKNKSEGTSAAGADGDTTTLSKSTDGVADLPPRPARKAERRVIRDDETMLAIQDGMGWGGKRRLRERKKDENEEMMF